MFEIDSLKTSAAGRWPEIISSVAGIDAGLLDGKHHPCPRCGGTDRFRMIDEAAGALFCNQCFKSGNGDGIAAIQWAAGCDFSEACERIAKHLQLNTKPKVVARFDYRDEAGELLYVVERWEPGQNGRAKDFKARKPGSHSIKGVRRVLYRLPELTNADPTEIVFIPEGEKHCDALVKLGLVATCNPFGAGKWQDEYSESLKNRHVVILPDNDDVGRDHASDIAASLDGIAASVRELCLPGLPPKGDVIDWLAAGGTNDSLLSLVARDDKSDRDIVVVDNDEPRAIDVPEPASESLLRMPGFVGAVMDTCIDTAPYPNVPLAFCGALSLQAYLAARKIRDSGDIRTNIYCLGLAKSSAGKDWPRKLNTRILQEIGKTNALGDRFASAEGIQDALLTTPSMLFQTDEIDGLMQSISRERDERYIAIKDVLLSLYGYSSSLYCLRRLASTKAARKRKDGDSDKNDGELSIDQPSLVLFGTAIPKHYYSSLSEKVLSNGLLARMLVVECGKRSDGQESKLITLSDSIVEPLMWWDEMKCGPGNASDIHPEPLIVEATPDARTAIIDIRKANDAEYRNAEESDDDIATTIWGRATEHVRKLALIYAASEDCREPKITLEGVRWAHELVDRQVRRMLYMAKSHQADGTFDGYCQRVKRFLARAPDYAMSRSKLMQLTRLDQKTFDNVLNTMTQRGEVKESESATGGRGRKGIVYTLTSV